MLTDNYRMTFSAEFNDPNAPFLLEDGGQFSPTLAHWGNLRNFSSNNERQTYVDAGFGGSDAYNPFSLADGALTISAIPTPVGLRDDVSTPYVSGVLETSGGPAWEGRQPDGFWQQYGYWEMRAELPQGQGLWPAFWLVGMGEIDIMEVLGQDPWVVHNSTHGYNNGRLVSTSNAAAVNDLTEGYHTYGLEWTADALTFYVDGQVTTQLDGAAYRNFGPSFMVINLAVGGAWGGVPDSTTPFPAEMSIDYVRAYQMDANGSPIATAAPTRPAADLILNSTTAVYLDGGGGRDVLVGHAGADWLNGGDGDDTMTGNAGNDVQSGGSGNDTLSGGAGDDRLYADAGNDSISGGSGDDVIYAGMGDDWMSFGAGRDVFVTYGNEGRDVIADFVRGEDQIRFIGVARGDISWQVVQGNGGPAIRIDLVGDNSITLEHLTTLSQSDFVLT